MGIFTPLSIGNLQLKNRLFRSATFEAGATSDGAPTKEHHRIYDEILKGDCGLIFTGIAYISDEGKNSPKQNGIHKSELISEWKKITDRVHRQNGKIVVQLSHRGGSFVLPNEN